MVLRYCIEEKYYSQIQIASYIEVILKFSEKNSYEKLIHNSKLSIRRDFYPSAGDGF